ncbi:uncharacterized protein [Euwallacea fornicatus]|uniref:uncharacterized protein n=1 Tax=Euwallacea fornicatus TaxID=995702 RepID=UPI00338DF738
MVSMKTHVVLIVVLSISGKWGSWGRPIVNDPESYKYENDTIFYGEPVLLHSWVVQPERTQALINNTMVAGGMFYRLLRAIYRAGTIVYSYMPPVPNPITG